MATGSIRRKLLKIALKTNGLRPVFLDLVMARLPYLAGSRRGTLGDLSGTLRRIVCFITSRLYYESVQD